MVEQLNRLASSGLGQQDDGKWDLPPSPVMSQAPLFITHLPCLAGFPCQPQSLRRRSRHGSACPAILRSLAGAGVSLEHWPELGQEKASVASSLPEKESKGAWMNSTRCSTHSEMPPGEAMPGLLSPAHVVAGPQPLEIHSCVQLTLTSHSIHTHLTLRPLSRKGCQTDHNHTPVPGDTRPVSPTGGKRPLVPPPFN